MIQDKAQSVVARFSCLPVGIAQNTTWLGMSFTRAATLYWIIQVTPFGRIVKPSSAVLRLLARTRRPNIVRRAIPMETVRIVTPRDAPCGQPLHNSLNPSNHPCWTTISSYNRNQSNAGPGSVFLPGATSQWPAICRVEIAG